MVNYEIIYSKRRTLCLQIKCDGKIIVRAPRRTSKKQIESFVREHTDWINKKLEGVKNRISIDSLEKNELDELKARAKEIILPRVEYYSSLMNLFPLHVSINSAKTRFGSCSSKKRINFSCRLVLYPIKAIDYVCVHELAHLKELNHSKRFWALVEKYLPDYKERKKLLK